jgi:hypothetical protein
LIKYLLNPQHVNIVHTYIINRIEVNLFMLSPEIEDPGEVNVGNWTMHKKTFYSEFSFAALTVK